MGLAIEVGMYASLLKHAPEEAKWLTKTYSMLQQVLKENRLEGYSEPKSINGLNGRTLCSSFPYSYLHYLRRFYAHCVANSNWEPTPVVDGVDPTKDPVVNDESMMLSSHLLCHSDCEGFYLPVEFNEILIDEKNRIPGGLLGSSYKLLEELVSIAAKLGIELDNGVMSDEEAVRVNKLSESGQGFHRELVVWIALFEAARLSIEYKTSVTFC